MSLVVTKLCLRTSAITSMRSAILWKQHVLTGIKPMIPLCVSSVGILSKYSPLPWISRTRTYSSSTKNLDENAEDVLKHLEAENIHNRRRKLSPTDEMINVGRLVPHRVLDLVDETGETLKSVSSSNAVKLSQEKDLKLVLVNQHAKPLPLYKLMTGSELHKEQMKMNERRKSKAGPTIVKDIKLSSTIGLNDINVKKNHISDWLLKENNLQIRVTVMKKGRQAHSKEDMIAIIHKLTDGLEVPLVFNNEPKTTGKNGQNISVVLRRMSAKEKAKNNKEKNLFERMKSTPSSSSDG
ncbi:putative translation initiation factor IF-3, mitochondrial [Apostichopus japonicus]|uniref:Putative translation initiation factor IF-3, mitochondrial n=1 Tax=Stichopus japonicus TaxID=307972 RepID=A0A2G8KJH3_STIJA|nr:putative translation initiation factor IF-3, mitochondrial [Apostichopus japonicus]